MRDDSRKPRVAIVGGGLGGLTCAKYLVDVGVEVELFEALPYLGGRASTYRDADGDWIEQGLHVFFGTYSEFKQLLREIGQPADRVLFWRDDLYFAEPNGPRAVLGINPFHAPLRTIWGFLGNNAYLHPRDKLSLLPLIAPALLPMKQLERYDDRTVAEHWRRTSGEENLLERLLQPFCRAVQFTHAEEFSAYDFLGWVHQTIYGLPSSRLGGYRGARDETIFQPLAQYIEARGATIRTGVKIGEILYSQELREVTGFVREDGTRVEADAYVVAVPAWTFVPMIPEPLRTEPFFAEIATMPVAAAIAVQLWLDRRVIAHDGYHLLPRTEVVVFQDQSLRTYPHSGSRLSVDIAPAEDFLEWDDAAIVHHTLDRLGAAYPKIATAQLQKSVVLRHRHHLLRPLPGVMARRPSQVTPVTNLFLAGDWTQQEFFGSQEGAVRGGKLCAQALRARLSQLP